MHPSDGDGSNSMTRSTQQAPATVPVTVSRASQPALSNFASAGHSLPFRVLPADRCAAVQEQLLHEVLATPGPNHRNEQQRRDDASCRHVDVQEIRRLGSSPAVVDAVCNALESDRVTLFISRIWTKLPAGVETREWSSSGIPWHQDNAYFPIEPKVSVNAWVAISHVDRSNGGLELVPGSHGALLDTEKPPGTVFPRTRETLLNPRDDGMAVDLQPGECFLFSGSLLHRSSPNNSNHPRVGIQFNFVPTISHLPDDYPYVGAWAHRIHVERVYDTET